MRNFNWKGLVLSRWRRGQMSTYVKQLVKSGMVVLDIGAGYGNTTLLLAQAVGPRGAVYALEPNPDSFQQLRLKFDSRAFPQVTLYPIPIMHKSGLHSLAIPPTSSKLKSAMDCLSLDTYAERFLARLDFIHVDVNGYAIHVILGGFKTIRNFRPTLAIKACEENLRREGFCTHYLLQWLKALGYSPMPTARRRYRTFEEIIKKAEAQPSWSFEVIFMPGIKVAEKKSKVNNQQALKSSSFSLSKKSNGPIPASSEVSNCSLLSKMKSLRYVVAYTADRGRYMNKTLWHERWLARLRAKGFLVQGFSLTVNPPGVWLGWPELERRWRRRDYALLTMYERLAQILQNNDVLIHYGGANLHPDFLRQLSTFNTVCYYDDPDASELQSHYTAYGYDFVFVGNVSCLDMYRAWGIRNMDFLPLGVREGDYDSTLTEERILKTSRNLPIVFLGQHECHRDLWLLPLLKAFPETIVYGYGWPGGYLPYERQTSFYTNSRIGWNMDQSTGPVTSRTYRLPANGVLLIGNNCAHLGKLFKLDEEAIGFDTLEECIEYTRYYLANEQECRQIALRGWQRTMKEYAEVPLWERLLSAIQPHVINGIVPRLCSGRFEGR